MDQIDLPESIVISICVNRGDSPSYLACVPFLGAVYTISNRHSPEPDPIMIQICCSLDYLDKLRVYQFSAYGSGVLWSEVELYKGIHTGAPKLINRSLSRITNVSAESKPSRITLHPYSSLSFETLYM